MVFQPKELQTNAAGQSNCPELLHMCSDFDRHDSCGNRIHGGSLAVDSNRHAGNHARDRSGLVGGLPGVVAGIGASNLLHDGTKRPTHHHRRTYPSADLGSTAVTGNLHPDIRGAVGAYRLVAAIISGELTDRHRCRLNHPDSILLWVGSVGRLERIEYPWVLLCVHPDHQSHHHLYRSYPHYRAAEYPDR